MRESVDVRFGGEALRLLRDRALVRVERGDLVVADLHLGKPEAFRAHGSPVPEGVTEHDLGRLSAMIRETGAARLVVLGDLLHSRHGATGPLFEAMARWQERHAGVEVLLVRGNHDRKSGALPHELGIVEVDPPFDDGLVLLHEPEAAPAGRCCLAGHVHPSVRAPGLRMSGACFAMSERLCILPSFGTFTGSRAVEVCDSDVAFVCAREGLVPATRAAAELWSCRGAQAASFVER